MNNEIKEFLGDDAVKAVESDVQEACKMLCDALKLVWDYDSEMKVIYWLDDDDESLPCHAEELLRDLNLIAEIEKAVISKVGGDDYLYQLFCVTQKHPIDVRDNYWEATPTDLLSLATADAQTRCVALLLVLSEVE